MKYLKKFDTHSDYETFTGSTDFILPNVSYCVNEDEVHFNQIADTHEYVDLGLPSGTLWATDIIRNENLEPLYFAWGETQGYTSEQAGVDKIFNWENYELCNGTETSITKYCTKSTYGVVDNKTELEPEDDAATVYWGTDWTMPTETQLNELKNKSYCNYEFDNNGVIITSKSNGNSLFLPFYGCINASTLTDYNTNINYMSKTLSSNSNSAYVLRKNNNNSLVVISPRRYYGQCVIPVRASN